MYYLCVVRSTNRQEQKQKITRLNLIRRNIFRKKIQDFLSSWGSSFTEKEKEKEKMEIFG